MMSRSLTPATPEDLDSCLEADDESEDTDDDLNPLKCRSNRSARPSLNASTRGPGLCRQKSFSRRRSSCRRIGSAWGDRSAAKSSESGEENEAPLTGRRQSSREKGKSKALQRSLQSCHELTERPTVDDTRTCHKMSLPGRHPSQLPPLDSRLPSCIDMKLGSLHRGPRPFSQMSMMSLESDYPSSKGSSCHTMSPPLSGSPRTPGPRTVRVEGVFFHAPISVDRMTTSLDILAPEGGRASILRKISQSNDKNQLNFNTSNCCRLPPISTQRPPMSKMIRKVSKLPTIRK